tara:strand:+ start:3460 stop:4029 length:570 start_codon:yes stop_codon:yes gene_type:complete
VLQGAILSNSNNIGQVNNMKQTNWNTNTQKVRAWAENQDPSDNLQMVMLTLTMGDNAGNDELRSTYWTAIRSIGSTLDNFPTARRGRESTLTEEQDSALMAVEATLTAAFASIPTEYHALLLSVCVPHGRTGGVYADMDAYINKQVSSAHAEMVKSIKESRWDGVSLDDGVPQITPSLTKADLEESEEE